MPGWMGKAFRLLDRLFGRTEQYGSLDDQIESRTGWRPSKTVTKAVGWIGAGLMAAWTYFSTGVGWISAQGWGAWPIAGLILTLLTGLTLLALLAVAHGALTLRERLTGSHASLLRRRGGVFSAERRIGPPHNKSVDEGAKQEDDLSPQYNQLLTFFLRYLEPIASAQLALQQAILSAGIKNEQVLSLAMQSISSSPFQNSLSLITGYLGSSPARRPSFDELIVSIHNAEFNYRQCVDDTIALAHSLGVSIKLDEHLSRLWED